MDYEEEETKGDRLPDLYNECDFNISPNKTRQSEVVEQEDAIRDFEPNDDEDEGQEEPMR